MYQASAMKLQAEKGELSATVDDARERLDQGQAPTDDTEQDWYCMERERQQAREMQEKATARKQEEADRPSNVTRTTAEPRPNAYIPDDLGIPKPYGGYAPFKPTDAGATMRHIRRPQPREIEL